ncbi:winged helix-turn-helix domain-containing protein [Paraburkholderia aromaticivorans]|uniref:winged helix-turn-helix domain-containing protein n=1 Tax=Paraburkholderia aromaticivorans TaxID=2026199 RepID=UPI0038BA16CD
MSKNSCIVRFDWQHDRVSVGHIAVRVAGQEKEVLRLMVESAGQVCDREALMGVVWGERAIHMDELYLTQLVYRLRKSLRPLGLGGHIVTMPRAGYRFDPEGLRFHTEEASPDDAPTSLDALSTDESPPRRAGLRNWLARLRDNVSYRRASSESIGLPAIHTDEGLVTHAGATVHLTGFERALLQAFVDQPDVTLKRHELISRIWGDEEDVDVNRLTRLVSRLRRSLQPLGLDQQLLYIPCIGYRFCRTVPPTPADIGEVESSSLPSATGAYPSVSGVVAALKWIAPWFASRRTVVLIGVALLTLTAALAMPADLGNGSRLGRPVTARHNGSAIPTTCSADYVHHVFIRDVVDSVAASNSPTVPANVDNAWKRIVVDLRAAGCRSVAPSAPS